MMPALHNFGEVLMEYKDYPIGGKMIIARVAVPDNVMARDLSDEKAREEVRELLVQELASAILSKQLCEITQQKDPIHYKTVIAARCYVAPDSTVKLLRTLK
jgi:hypothetical protein